MRTKRVQLFFPINVWKPTCMLFSDNSFCKVTLKGFFFLRQKCNVAFAKSFERLYSKSNRRNSSEFLLCFEIHSFDCGWKDCCLEANWGSQSPLFDLPFALYAFSPAIFFTLFWTQKFQHFTVFFNSRQKRWHSWKLRFWRVLQSGNVVSNCVIH